MDKTISGGYYLIDLERDHSLPKTIKMVITAGVKNPRDPDTYEGEEVPEHLSWHFEYTFNEWGKVERFVVPPEAKALLKK